jgi:hypothetical protein
MISFRRYDELKRGKCEILNILGPSLDERNIPKVVYGKFPLVNIKVDGEWETVICTLGNYRDQDPKGILPLKTTFNSGNGLIYPEISFTTRKLAYQFLSSMKIIKVEDWDTLRISGHGAICKDRIFRCYDHV